MEAYQGYFENGRFIPIDGRTVPNNKRAIVTILDELPPRELRAGRQRTAFESFVSKNAAIDEALGSEFDEIVSSRVNITREIDL